MMVSGADKKQGKWDSCVQKGLMKLTSLYINTIIVNFKVFEKLCNGDKHDHHYKNIEKHLNSFYWLTNKN